MLWHLEALLTLESLFLSGCQQAATQFVDSNISNVPSTCRLATPEPTQALSSPTWLSQNHCPPALVTAGPGGRPRGTAPTPEPTEIIPTSQASTRLLAWPAPSHRNHGKGLHVLTPAPSAFHVAGHVPSSGEMWRIIYLVAIIFWSVCFTIPE